MKQSRVKVFFIFCFGVFVAATPLALAEEDVVVDTVHSDDRPDSPVLEDAGSPLTPVVDPLATPESVLPTLASQEVQLVGTESVAGPLAEGEKLPDQWWIPEKPYELWKEDQLEAWVKKLEEFRNELVESKGETETIASVDEQIRQAKSIIARII